MEHQSKSSPTIRWVCLIPCACFAAWGAWFLVLIGNRLTVGSQGIDPDSFLIRVFTEFMSHAVMGAAFVYAGAKVAPSYQKRVVYALTALGLVLAGFMLFPAFIISDYWAIWSGISLVIGLGATAYSVSVGDVNFDL